MNTKSINKISVCRLCANFAENCETNNLFHKSNEVLIQQIKELTGLRLRDMPRQMLPRYICSNCKQNLPSAYNFRKKIIETQSFFKTKDYRFKLERQVEDDKPTFDFAQLNECEIDETFVANTWSVEADEERDNEIALPELVKNVIKKEALDLENQSIRIIDVNDSNIKVNAKRRKLSSCKVLQSPSSSLKEEDSDVSNGNENLQYAEDNFDLKNTFVEKVSEDSSAEDSDHCDDSEDADFVVKFKKSHKEQPQKLNEKSEPDILKDRQFKCYLCQCPIENLTCLKIHFQKRHRREKFKCDLCEEKFPTVKTLVRHFRSFHNGEKEYKCSFCELRFDYMSTRVRHERRMHSKDSPFLCSICGKSFITAYMGREHMTVHTKERAFHCAVCNANFLRKTHLRTHYRSMTHKNNEQKLNEVLSSNNATNCQQYSNVQDQFLTEMQASQI